MARTAFGRRLAELRAERGLSLRALGELAHFSRGYLWDLEAGTKLPSPSSAARIDQARSAGGQLATLASAAPSPLQQVEALRQQVNDTVTNGGLAQRQWTTGSARRTGTASRPGTSRLRRCWPPSPPTSRNCPG